MSVHQRDVLCVGPVGVEPQQVRGWDRESTRCCCDTRCMFATGFAQPQADLTVTPTGLLRLLASRHCHNAAVPRQLYRRRHFCRWLAARQEVGAQVALCQYHHPVDPAAPQPAHVCKSMEAAPVWEADLTVPLLGLPGPRPSPALMPLFPRHDIVVTAKLLQMGSLSLSFESMGFRSWGAPASIAHALHPWPASLSKRKTAGRTAAEAAF